MKEMRDTSGDDSRSRSEREAYLAITSALEKATNEVEYAKDSMLEVCEESSVAYKNVTEALRLLDAALESMELYGAYTPHTV